MELHFINDEIEKMEKRYCVAFINSLSGFKSLNIIGTKAKNGQTNAAIFNSVFHLGADPALMGFIMRPDTVQRDTLLNIEQTNYYTVNHVNSSIYANAHQTSARYPSNISEFDTENLTPIYKNNFWAPFVKESHINIALCLQDIISIPINNTKLVVGEIIEVYVPEGVLLEDGTIDLELSDTIGGSSLNGYHNTQLIKRLPYALPKSN